MSSTTQVQYGTPVVCQANGETDFLQRIELRHDPQFPYTEQWLQKLIFHHPQVLPVNEIDPIFGELIPVCRELSTPVGFLDNLYVNALGMLTLVECKLWRNPEARRKVVGQILDYAQEVSRWSYEDLLHRLQSTLHATGNILFDIVQQHDSTLKEHTFIDNVSRNLRKGRFLLLIVGDGIRENVENISTYLQEHAQLNFTFALVEETLFTLPEPLNGNIIRVVAK